MPSYNIPHDPKMVHEAMCLAEGLILRYRPEGRHYAKIVGDLIRECERKRPLGSNGKHGNLHTPECGCEDQALTEEQIFELMQKLCPTCQGGVFNERTGKWIKTRETKNLVCQTCGRDYAQHNPRPTRVF